MTTNIKRARTLDGMTTFDSRTIDSTGAFLIGELTRLDQTLHGPLAIFTYSRDIDLREDVSAAQENTAYTNSTFSAVGGTSPDGKAWIGKNASAIASMQLDTGITTQPLTLWGMETSWTIPELQSAQLMGRPVDSQKYEGMKLKWNMDVDEACFIGDTVIGTKGLFNNGNVTVVNAPNGSWTTTTTADDMLADVNNVLKTAWAASAYALAPTHLLVDPTSFGVLVTTKVSSAGNMSVLEYIKQNSISNAVNGRPLTINPNKWATGRGASSKNRMVAYTKDQTRVRFPLVPLQRTPLEYRGLFQSTTYYGRIGELEVVYPESIAYSDGQ